MRVKGKRPDIMLIEVGGTVGDIESMAYYEAIRQMIHNNPKNYCLVFLTYVPNVSASGEQKTKIAQQGIKELELSARKTATGFYEKLGYHCVGEYYLEQGIDHIKMQKVI